jgi:uncharacterized membrane protein YeaQ/YmgE (transglycosylase-associated protein family)
MTFIELLLLLLVAGLAGALGQAIGGYSHSGCLVSIALGFIGALVGRWIARALALPPVFLVHIGGITFPLIWAVLGAALFVAFVNLLTRRKRL